MKMTRKIDLKDDEIVLLCKALQSKIGLVKKWVKIDKEKENKYYYQKDLKEIKEYQNLLNKMLKEIPEGLFVIK